MRLRASHLASLLLAVLIGAPSAVSGAEAIHLHTEDFPPYSMAVDGTAHTLSPAGVTGFAAEIVKELMLRADVPYTLDLVPWKRAYDQALSLPGHGVFSTTRTPSREALFAWVGPIASNNWVFMGRSDSPIRLERLADAEAYRIGGYLEDAVADYLEEQGLSVEYVANDVLNVRKLARGRIDLWPVVQLKGQQLAKQEGIEVKEIFTIKSTEMALAMNLDTPAEVLALLQQTMRDMHGDGTVDRITRKLLQERDSYADK